MSNANKAYQEFITGKKTVNEVRKEFGLSQIKDTKANKKYKIKGS